METPRPTRANKQTIKQNSCGSRTVITTLRRQRLKSAEFEVSLGYREEAMSQNQRRKTGSQKEPMREGKGNRP